MQQKFEKFSQLSDDRLMTLINGPQQENICMHMGAFLLIDPNRGETKTFSLKEKYKPSNQNLGLYSEILSKQRKNSEEIDQLRDKLAKQGLLGTNYNNEEASLKCHISINNIGEVDQKIITGLIEYLNAHLSVEKKHDISYMFKIVKPKLVDPENINATRFGNHDQITIYFDKYSSTLEVINLANQIKQYLESQGIKNKDARGPKDSFGFNPFVSARFDTNKLLNGYEIFKFFDLELAKFFDRYQKKEEELKEIPLCAFEAVFYNCLLSKDTKINREGLSERDSKYVQQQMEKMRANPAEYLRTYNKDFSFLCDSLFVNQKGTIKIIEDSSAEKPSNRLQQAFFTNKKGNVKIIEDSSLELPSKPMK